MQRAPGVNRIRVDRDSWNITIWYDPGATDPARLSAAIDAATDEVESRH